MISSTVYFTAEQWSALERLNKQTRVPVAAYVREGVDMLLQKYAAHLPEPVEAAAQGVTEEMEEDHQADKRRLRGGD